MRTSLLVKLLSVLLLPCPCLAQWSGFPFDETTTEDWSSIRTNHSPISQLYSATVERAVIAGISAPSIVESWQWYAGTNLVATNINGYTYTNLVLLSTNVVTTNAIGPTEYQYTDMSGTHTATGFPYVTRYFMRQLDTTIEAAIPYFVSTNVYTTNYNKYFIDHIWNAAGENISANHLPTETKAGMFSRYGVGYVTNITEDSYGWINGGDAYWTKEVSSTQGLVLAESHYSTNASDWEFVNQNSFNTNYYAPVGTYPGIIYTPATTNTALPITVTVTGLVFNITNQTLSAASEVINVAFTNTPLSNYWYSISDIESASAATNKDVISVVWTNQLVTYGSWAFELNKKALNERYTIINGLRWTQAETVDTADQENWEWSLEESYTNTSYALAKADASAAGYNWTTNAAAASGGIISYSQFKSGDYIATMWDNVKWRYRVFDIPTNYQHSAELYTVYDSVLGYPYQYYDFKGTHPSNNYFAFETSYAESASTNHNYSNAWISAVDNYPTTNVSVYVDQGPGGTVGSRVSLWLLKWDGANGLKYK